MKTNQQTYKPRFLGKETLIAVAAVFLFGCAQNALAQVWSSDANNNIYKNPTTGNVGIGTTSPQGKLQINTSDTEKALQLFHNYSATYGNSTTFGRLTSEVSDWWGFTNNAYYSGGNWYLDDTTKGGQGFALDSYAGGNRIWIGGW